MSKPVRLLFFAGSARVASLNKRLAKAAEMAAAARGAATTFVDLADYAMPLYDGDLEAMDGTPEAATRLKTVIDAHDGVFVASPEYNASISPLLKNTIDWLSRLSKEEPSGPKVMKSKVWALGAASPGGTGGMRGLVAVRYTLEMGIGCLVLPDQVLVARANAAFADDGTLSDKDGAERLADVVGKLERAARLFAATPA